MKSFFRVMIYAGFAATVAAIVFLFWTSNQRIKLDSELAKLDSRRSEIILNLSVINSEANAYGNGARGFFIADSQRYLEFLNQRNIDLAFRRLRLAFRGQERLLAKITELEKNISERIRLNYRIIEAARNDREAADLRKLSEEDWQRIRETNVLTAQIEDETAVTFGSMKQALQKKEDNYKIAEFVLLVVCVLLLAAALLVIMYYLRLGQKAERRLEENRQFLRSVIDNSSSAVFVKHINGEYLLVNRQFERMFRRKHNTVKGMTDQQIFPQQIAARMRAADLEVIKAAREMKFEEVFPQNGNEATLEVIRFPLTDAQGKIYAIAAMATDVTITRTEDEMLRESRSQFEALFNAAPDAIVVIDEQSTIVKWNPESEKLFKWKSEEVVGRLMPDIIMPERYREKHYEGMRHYLHTGEGPILNSTVELSALDRNNREFDIELTVSTAMLKEKRLFIAFIREISERKQIERERVKTKNFLDSIIENIPDMIFVKDAKDLRFVLFNKAGEELLGYTRSELIGKNDYDFFPREEADFFTQKDRNVLNSGNPTDIPEEKIDTRSGKRLLHTKKIPIRDDTGEPAYLLGISEDITEKKQLDTERRMAEKQVRDEKTKLRMILENIGEGVVVADTQQRVILFNRMAGQIFEADRMDSIAWSDFYNIYYPDGFTVFPAQDLPLEKALKGHVTEETELVMQNIKTGHKKLVKVTGHPILDDRKSVIGAVSTLRDITKFRQLEAALQESETKYRKLIGFRYGTRKGGKKDG